MRRHLVPLLRLVLSPFQVPRSTIFPMQFDPQVPVVVSHAPVLAGVASMVLPFSSPPYILDPSFCRTRPHPIEYCFTSLTSDHVANAPCPHRLLSTMFARFLKDHSPSSCCPRTRVILFLSTLISHVIRLLINRFPTMRLHLDQKCGAASGDLHSQ